jgi:ribonuclease HII
VLGEPIEGLTDSKQLTKKRREALNEIILQSAKAVGLGWVQSDELDDMGLGKALELACRRALEQIMVPYHEIIIDGTVNLLKDTGKGAYVTTLKKADLLVPSVSAASIVAKVARDNWMAQQDALYPGYGFKAHVGYGTAQHLAALQALGPTPLHRRSFAPVARIVGDSVAGAPKNPLGQQSTTRAVGNASEAVAAAELEKRGYRVIERNWKTRFCEIDIVAEKDHQLYFVEVKHRKDARSGSGLAAITARKLARMKFAAELYRQRRGGEADASLMAVTTTGSPPVFESLLVIE